MNVVIMSVPKTGTNFTKRLFRDLGWEDVPLNMEPNQENAYWSGHIRGDDQIKRAIGLSKKHPLICPLRHPYRVEESWRVNLPGRPIDQMVEGFEMMMDTFMPLKPYILPVDSTKRRTACLKKIIKGTGVNVSTDWNPVGAFAGTHNLEIDQCNPSERVIKLVKDMDKFLSYYYG